MPGLDPVSLGLGGLQTLFGIGQSIFGGSRERKAENAIENLKSPTYSPNSSIMDYYNKALQRYNTNPYQSQQYQTGIQQGNRTTAAGINALQDRGSAIGGISRLAALQNNNALQQGVAAENTQNQRFSQLGGAAQMSGNEGRYAFQTNQLMPYQQKLQLLGAKASGGAQMLNSGFSNIFGGLGTASMSNLGGGNIFGNNNATNGSSSNSNVNLNQITGGLSGNWGTLQGGNPFAVNASDYTNQYGE